MGDTMKYCTLRLAAAVVLPKCAAARAASVPSWAALALDGDAALLSSHVPASAPPVG